VIRALFLLALFLLTPAFGACGQGSRTEPVDRPEQRRRVYTEDDDAHALPVPRELPGRGLRYEETTEYSHFKIYDRSGVRYLMFVRDNGHEVVESAIDLQDPDRLAIEYTRVMFVSHLFRPEPARALLIGLGGGAMVRFMRRFFPDTSVTAVEIDPGVVRAAEAYFGVVPGENCEILTEDGFDYVARGGDSFDVIYMDAFLKPSTSTDEEGAPLNMRTLAFLRQLRGRLTPGGVLVININVTDETQSDIDTLRQAFPHVYLFDGGGNVIAVGHNAEDEVSTRAMLRNGRRLDSRADYGFSFEELLERRSDEF
jgi:spermidine synthase